MNKNKISVNLPYGTNALDSVKHSMKREFFLGRKKRVLKNMKTLEWKRVVFPSAAALDVCVNPG